MMQRFYFRARSRDGALIQEALDAIDLRDAKKRISDRGLVTIEVNSKIPLHEKLARAMSRVSTEEFLTFNRQLQIVYSVGMPIVRGLTLIEEQTSHPLLKETLQRIRADIANGLALHEAFSKHGDIFDQTYINLLKVGEASGRLDMILDRISKFAEKRVENEERIKSATLYPKIVVFVLAAVFCVVVFFVIPRIKRFFDQFNAELPAVTRYMMSFAGALVQYWYLFVTFTAVAIYVWKLFSKSTVGRGMIDQMVLTIPVAGPLVRMIETNAFCSTLELLIGSGVPILDALRLTRNALKNSLFRAEVDRCITTVDNGGTISQVLSKTEMFPTLLGGLVAVGEDTGEMGKVLHQVGTYYQSQINHRLENLSKTLEPILLFIVFLAVLGLALAVYLPLWRMSAVIKR